MNPDYAAILAKQGPLAVALILVVMIALGLLALLARVGFHAVTQMVSVELYKDALDTNRVAAERLCSQQHTGLDDKIEAIAKGVGILLDRGHA